MDQMQIGRFLAACRRERGLTQQQLADRLNVNMRSVSRWETGRCMPDLSLLQFLAAELDITVPELLEGRRAAGAEDSLPLLLDYMEQETRWQGRRIVRLVAAGALCMVLALTQSAFGLFDPLLAGPYSSVLIGLLAFAGLGLTGMGLWQELHRQTLSPREAQILLRRDGPVSMTTAGEMLHYACRFQNARAKAFRAAFDAIEQALAPGENVLFAATGTEYSANDQPGYWHTALAVTPRRLLVAGERATGRLFVAYPVDHFAVDSVRDVRVQRGVFSSGVLFTAEKDAVRFGQDSPGTAQAIADGLSAALEVLRH